MNSAHYVYAIVHRDSDLNAIASSVGSELAMVPCRELAAVTRCVHQDGREPATMKAVLQHEAVVESLRSRYPALPVRFGTLFRSADSIASSIEERYALLVADLDRVGDKAELSITALWAAPPCAGDAARHADDAPAMHEGARYLRARAFDLLRDEARKARARAVAQEIDDTLGTFALERRASFVPTPRIAVRAAYLLDPANVGRFRAAFDVFREARIDMRLLLTGPWPPYGFVRHSEDEERRTDHRLGQFARLLTEELQERCC